jgi:cation transport ATPase
VTAIVEGRVVRVGSPELLREPAVAGADKAPDHTRRAVAELEESGRTAVVVLVDDMPVGVLGVGEGRRTAGGAQPKGGVIPVREGCCRGSRVRQGWARWST